MVLVAAVLNGGSRSACEEHLDELALLAETAGYEVCDRIVQDLGRPEASTFLRRGKVNEVARRVKASGAHRVLLDDDLSPQQGAELEKKLGVPVADRSGLILDIFASRARTREARTQVELASLHYVLPRLARRWTHLSRQEGGIGVRGGVGETQIELDRRMIRRRISRLERDLGRIRQRRSTRQRGRRGIFNAALVGYTNSGKSTLFNALTRAGAQVENRLFATLDPLRRKMAGRPGEPPGQAVIMTDTVGFIRKLPHHLVASFRSTLEQAGEADLLVQVVDAADPHLEEKMQVTREVLAELGLEDRRCLLVLNKCDLLADGPRLARLARRYPEAVRISAHTGEGLLQLRERLLSERERNHVVGEVRIDARDSEALSLLHRNGFVLDMVEDAGSLLVRYRADRAGAGRIARSLGNCHV